MRWPRLVAYFGVAALIGLLIWAGVHLSGKDRSRPTAPTQPTALNIIKNYSAPSPEPVVSHANYLKPGKIAPYPISPTPPDLLDQFAQDTVQQMQEIFYDLNYYRQLSGGVFPKRLDYLIPFNPEMSGLSSASPERLDLSSVTSLDGALACWSGTYDYIPPVERAGPQDVLLKCILEDGEGTYRLYGDGAIDWLKKDGKKVRIAGPIHLPSHDLEPPFLLGEPGYPPYSAPTTLKEWKRLYARWWLWSHCFSQSRPWVLVKERIHLPGTPKGKLVLTDVMTSGDWVLAYANYIHRPPPSRAKLDFKDYLVVGKVTVFIIRFDPGFDSWLGFGVGRCQELGMLGKANDDLVILEIPNQSLKHGIDNAFYPVPNCSSAYYYSSVAYVVYGPDGKLVASDAPMVARGFQGSKLVDELINRTVYDRFDPEHPKGP